MKNTKITNCSLIDLPKISADKGNITPINSFIDVPFDIKRVYYLYDVPGGEIRGGHAHRELHQLIISVSGSFDLVLNDGKDSITYSLNRPYFGLHIVPGIWRKLTNFSSGSICLVLASEVYSTEDYIRDFTEFKELKNE